MGKDQLKIPRFDSLEEFRQWWSSPEVNRFCLNYPDKVARLRKLKSINPWILKLDGLAKQETAAEMAEREKFESINKTFGKYQIERKLGEGGMGVVYLASDPLLKRKVALKIMALKGKPAIERFMREARASAKLKHSNIVSIHEIDAIGKYHYFTMDYIEGESLDCIIKNKTLQPKQAAEIIASIAQALDYAHQQGIVHRDIKPANILIGHDKQVYLTDFGLAKEMDSQEYSLTLSGTVVGTPDYMSPEQAQALREQIDHRSDIFSLGATLYHAITGHTPFRGRELYQILDSVVNKEPVAPSRLMRTLPRDLETICLKCLEKDKKGRYQTAKELADDLKRYQAGDAISVRPKGVFAKLWSRVRKNKTATLTIAGSGAGLIVMAIILAVSSGGNLKQQVEEYRKEAQKAYSENRLEVAQTMCQKALELAPEDKEIQSLLMKCRDGIAEEERLQQERVDKLKEDMRQSRIKAEKRSKAKGILDRINAGKPSAQDRISAAQDALKADETYADAYQVMGFAYKDMRDFDKAYECFSKAIELDATLIYSYYQRGWCGKSRNKSEYDFNKVVELDPNGPMGWMAKGVLESHKGNYDSAISNYTEAIKRNPDYAEAYYNRAVDYERKGEIKKALEDYNKAVELNHDFDQAYNNRGLIYMNNGKLQEAMDDFDNAIALNKNHTKAYNNRGLLFHRLGYYDDAIRDFTTAIRISPNEPDPYYNRGLAYGKKEEPRKAIADFTKTLEIKPNEADAYYNRSVTYANIEQFDKAIADAEMGLKLAPNHQSAARVREWVKEWKRRAKPK